jgi:hypothetical protein
MFIRHGEELHPVLQVPHAQTTPSQQEASAITAHPSFVSSPILLRPALQNSALSLPALKPLRPISATPDEQQPQGGFFPVVVSAATPQRLAGSRSQNLARSPGDNGVSVLPIVPRILPGSTSDTTLSRSITRDHWTRKSVNLE